MKYKVKKSFIVQKMGDKTVLFDNDSSILYTLNETANYIFSQLKKGLSKSEIIQKMMKRYGIKEKKLSSDFDDVVKDLIKKEILS